jgi:rare lipoprotein A (peptidoglycan hydrolase)/uncharacterized coiled-coil protein SlyX
VKQFTIHWARSGLGTLLACLVALSIVVPAGASDLATVRARAQAAADSVTDLERRIATLERRQAHLAERIEHASAEIAGLELGLRTKVTSYELAQEQLVSRAIELYKSGGTADVEVLLSTDTLGDVYEVSEVQSKVAAADSALVQELETQKERTELDIEQIDASKQAMMADQRRIAVTRDSIAATLSKRREVLARLNDEIKDLEEQARRAAASAAAASNSTVAQALLDILSGSGPADGIPSGFATTGVSFEGLASWYGPGFEGNPTANGDIFDPDLYTAASKELPLGSWLYIEHNGAGVVVYVNDRGPYVGERILDLSRAAAEAVGLTGPGVGWVRAEILVKT